MSFDKDKAQFGHMRTEPAEVQGNAFSHTLHIANTDICGHFMWLVTW